MKKLFLLMSVLFLLGCSKYGQFYDVEITVYPVRCDGKLDKATNHCNGKLKNGNRKTFKVSANRQEVMYWTPGVSEVPHDLYTCIVRDSENWQCEGGLLGATSMEQGNLIRQYETGVYYISKWRWWYLKLTHSDLSGGSLTSNSSKASKTNWYGEGEKGFWDSVLVSVIFWSIILTVVLWIRHIKKRISTKKEK